MVAVADGEDHRNALEAGVLFADSRGVLGQRLVEIVNVLALDEPAGDMAAAFHEVKVVDLFEAVFFRADRLDELLVVVIAEHQHMGKLDGRVAANALTGRNALWHGALGGADGRRCAGVIVIRVKVDHAN